MENKIKFNLLSLLIISMPIASLGGVGPEMFPSLSESTLIRIGIVSAVGVVSIFAITIWGRRKTQPQDRVIEQLNKGNVNSARMIINQDPTCLQGTLSNGIILQHRLKAYSDLYKSIET